MSTRTSTPTTSPTVVLPGQRGTAPTPPRHRGRTAAAIVAALAAAAGVTALWTGVVTGSDEQSLAPSPVPAQFDGSDQHLQNQADDGARLSEGSDRHLQNQADDLAGRAGATHQKDGYVEWLRQRNAAAADERESLGSDRHLENMADRPVG